jgi:hypothetical protein
MGKHLVLKIVFYIKYNSIVFHERKVFCSDVVCIKIVVRFINEGFYLYFVTLLLILIEVIVSL